MCTYVCVCTVVICVLYVRVYMCMFIRVSSRGVTRHLAHETRRIARLGRRDVSRDIRCHLYPINNEHNCTSMNTNVIKHVNMVIIITFIWHLTYI